MQLTVPTARARWIAVGVCVTAAIAAGGATSASAATTQADGDQVVGPLVTETSSFQGAPAFAAPLPGAAGQEIAANRAATLAGALDRAVDWYLPAPGTVGPVRPVSAPDLCLSAATATAGINSRVTLESCVDGAVEQRFSLASNQGSNNPIGTGLRSERNGGFLGLYNNDPVMRLQVKEIADRLPNVADFLPAFDARIDRIDTLARTAFLSGRGTPNAQVLVDGANAVSIGTDGRWTAVVTGLAFGTNTIRLEQYVGPDRTGSTTLTAVLAADELTFTTTFSPIRDTPVQAAGTAHPGATVQLRDAAGTALGAPVTANATTGRWSTTIPAPNAAGTYAVTATQSLAGLVDSEHAVTRDVDYGAGVAVETPADGAAHAGGPLEMSGTGEPGSTIEVHDVTGGTDRIVGRGTDVVAPDGRWTLTTDDLDRAEHVLRVVQSSRGANTTTAQVTINPGSNGSLAPVVLTSPRSVTPGLSNTFRGTAEPGATYRVLNVSGTQIVPGTLTVGDDGTWEFERVVSTGATSFQFVIEQTKDGQTETSELFSIDANQGVAPVVVTTDAVLPGFVNTFEGTGPAGATYEVLNASGTVIVPGRHTIGDDGSWSFDRTVSAGSLRFGFKLRVTVDGSTFTTRLYDLPAATR